MSEVPQRYTPGWRQLLDPPLLSAVVACAIVLVSAVIGLENTDWTVFVTPQPTWGERLVALQLLEPTSETPRSRDEGRRLETTPHYSVYLETRPYYSIYCVNTSHHYYEKCTGPASSFDIDIDSLFLTLRPETMGETPDEESAPEEDLGLVLRNYTRHGGCVERVEVLVDSRSEELLACKRSAA